MKCARCGADTTFLYVNKENLSTIPLCVDCIVKHDKAMARFKQIEFTDQIIEVEEADEEARMDQPQATEPAHGSEGTVRL